MSDAFRRTPSAFRKTPSALWGFILDPNCLTFRFENFERKKYLKKLPSMQRVNTHGRSRCGVRSLYVHCGWFLHALSIIYLVTSHFAQILSVLCHFSILNFIVPNETLLCSLYFHVPLSRIHVAYARTTIYKKKKTVLCNSCCMVCACVHSDNAWASESALSRVYMHQPCYNSLVTFVYF